MSKRIVLLEALTAMPADLQLMLKNVSPASLWHDGLQADWSMTQLLAHLLTVEVRYLARLQHVVTTDNPFLPTIHPDETIQPTASLPDLLTQFATARAQTVAYLQALPPGAWQRPATHETQGATKLRYLVQMLVEHDTEHLNQLIDIQQDVRRNAAANNPS